MDLPDNGRLVVFCGPMRSLFFLCLLSCWLVGCHRVNEQQMPPLAYPPYKGGLAQADYYFPPLTEQECATDWGREYRLGALFAREADLYRAVTAFKRAAFLLPHEREDRLLEIRYKILLCYYLGEQFAEVKQMIDEGQLGAIDTSFVCYHDLLLILYESYHRLSDEERASYFQNKLAEYDGALAKKVEDLRLLEQGELATLAAAPEAPSYLIEIECAYMRQKKSVRTASLLNALLPGMGYWYVGQKQTAITAFIVNGLFIGAAVESFRHHNVPLGILLASFESGWYFGGIYGGGLAAKAYNDRLYSCYAERIARRERLYPILNLNFCF